MRHLCIYLHISLAKSAMKVSMYVSTYVFLLQGTRRPSYVGDEVVCVAYGIFTFYTISLSSEKLRAGCDCKTLTELSRSAGAATMPAASFWTAEPTRDGVCDSPLAIMVKLC